MWPVSINCNVLFLCCVYMLCAHSLKPTGLFSAFALKDKISFFFFSFYFSLGSWHHLPSWTHSDSVFLKQSACALSSHLSIIILWILFNSPLTSYFNKQPGSARYTHCIYMWNTVITMIKSEHKKLCYWGCGRKAGNYRSINFKKMRFRGRRRRRNREQLFVVKSLSCKVTQTWLEYEQANPPALTHIYGSTGSVRDSDTVSVKHQDKYKLQACLWTAAHLCAICL